MFSRRVVRVSLAVAVLSMVAVPGLSVFAAPADPAPADPAPADPAPADPAPADPAPADPAPADPAPADPAPADPAPADPAPADPAPADPAPADPAPADPAPVAPADPAPVAQSPGLRASTFDTVYARGVPIGVAMATTRWLESGNNYTAQAPGSTASGAYQIIDSTWNNYGGYAHAKDAPPAVQDQFAYDSFVAILKAHGDNIAAIPLAWYYPKALSDPALLDTIPAPEAGNTLTIRDYQQKWVNKFHELLGGGAPVFLPADTDPLIPAIAFPVLGPTSFVDDWHYARDGGARVHEGIDMMGVSGQPLRAAFDGEITAIRWDNNGTAGVGISVTRADGTYANYFHLNNDTPGTINNAADLNLRIVDGIGIGTKVRAGQIIAFMGDTGNAVGNAHLHFELRTVDGEPFAPYPAILEAQQREQCSVGVGPWSTIFSTTTASDPDTAPAAPYEISGPDDARWTISTDGHVTAAGSGAIITPGQGACNPVVDPDLFYGTDAAGMELNLLPADWLPVDDRDELERLVDAFTVQFGNGLSLDVDAPAAIVAGVYAPVSAGSNRPI